MQENKNHHYLLSGLDKIIDFVINFIIAYLCLWVAKILNPSQITVNNVRMFFIICVLCLVATFFYNYYQVYLPMRTRKPIFFVRISTFRYTHNKGV